MLFLDEGLLLKLLYTYHGAAKIENKPTPAKEKAPSILQRVADGAKTTALFVKDKAAGSLGYNTSEASKACCLEIEREIKKAAKNNTPEDWVELLCFIGEIGYHTHTTSYSEDGSDLFRTVFAILMEIRNQVTDKIHSNEPMITEKDKKDKQLALDIQKAIESRIEKYNLFLKNVKENIHLSKELNLGLRITNTLTINTDKVKKSLETSKDVVEIVQRHLYYLGGDPIVIEAYTKPAQEIFWKFTLYTDAIRKQYDLSDKQVEDITKKIRLPLQLHTIYPTLYIRDYAGKVNKIINNMSDFEKLEPINTAETKPVVSNTSNSLPPPATTTHRHREHKRTAHHSSAQPSSNVLFQPNQASQVNQETADAASLVPRNGL